MVRKDFIQKDYSRGGKALLQWGKGGQKEGGVYGPGEDALTRNSASISRVGPKGVFSYREELKGLEKSGVRTWVKG